MGLKLSQIGSTDVPIPVEFEGGTVTVRFNPHKLTRPFLDRLGDGVPEEDFWGEGAVVVGWDLLDDDEQPIPLTAAGLLNVPMFVRRAVVTAVLGATVPNGATTAETTNTAT